MPSIRRSLIAYFLILLGFALAGVGLLVDRFAGDMLRAREAAEARRIEQEYAARCADTERDFNAELEKQAILLGKELRAKYWSLTPPPQDREARQARDREYRSFRDAVGALGGGSAAREFQTFVTEGPEVRIPLFWVYWRNKADEQVRTLFAMEADDHPRYYRFDFPRPRRVLHNPNPARDLPPFPIDEYREDPKFADHFDDVSVGGVLVHRIIYKSALLGGGPPRGGPGPGTLAHMALVGGWLPQLPQLPPALLDRSFDPLPAVFVQVGRPKAELDALLAEHETRRRADEERLATEVREAMAGLRVKLALIGGATFVALAVGGWWLVGRGVRPLRKLSDAVSRVSEKDFRLPVDPDHLSHELVPIHDRLTHTLDALRRAFEREKQAVADISHELRTPIAALMTTLEVALRKPRSADQYKATLEECRDIGQQLRKLVERIMTLAWLDAGNDRTAAEPVDAAELAAGCAALIRPLAAARDIAVATDIDPGVHLTTDPDKLREVLMNLLHNAVEYNQPGGRVGLHVGRADGRVVFEVRDTGIGMTPDVREKIFERFYRADASRHATGVHAGLGLAIVKEYVDRLGGSIAVDSTPGEGSTFRVSLPAAAADRNGSAGYARPAARSAAGAGLSPSTPPR